MKAIIILLFLNLSFFSFKLFSQSDNCETATFLTLPGGSECYNGTTVGATSDNLLYNNGACNPAPVNEVWFTFVAQGPINNFTITSGTLQDAQIVLYTLDCPTGAGGQLQLCNVATGSNANNVSWGFSPGQQVWVGVMSNSGSEGTFELCVTSEQAPPSGGNLCSTAIPVCEGTTAIDMNTTTSSGVFPSCFLDPVNNDAWFTFDVLQSGTFEWEAIPTGLSSDVELDWALFDITNGCPTNQGGWNAAEVVCNYNFDGGSNGANGQTPGGNGEFNEPSNLIAGNTYVIVIDFFSNSSTGTMDFSVMGGSAVIAPNVDFSISPTTVTCGPSVTVNITDNSIGVPTWGFGDGTSFTGNNPPSHTYTNPGTYSITASIAGQCSDLQTEFVQLFGPLSATSTSTDETCLGDCDGTGSVSPSGGSGSYTYSWSPSGGNLPDASGLCSDNYTVTISDLTCGTSITEDISISSVVCVNCEITDILLQLVDCYVDAGGNAVWDIQGTVNYTDPPTTGTLTITSCDGQTQTFNPPFGNSQTFTFVGIPQSTGNCDITAVFTADAACTFTSSITINPFPIVDAGDNQVACDGEQVTLTADNPNGAAISWDNGVVDGVAFTPPSGTTTYTVTAELLSCVSTDQVDVTVTPNPVFTPAGTNPSGCGINDGFIVLSGLTPGAAYTVGYTNNGNPVGPLNLIADASGQLLITGLSIGDYTSFVVADATSLCTGINDTNITLVDLNAPNIDAGTDQEVCEGIQVTLTASNPDGAIISWDNGGNDGVPFNQVVGTTTYTVTANLDNCISTDQVTVIVNPIPNVFAGNDVTICLGDDVTLTASGAQSYNWDNGVTNGVPFIPTQTQTYTVIGTSQFGCEGTGNVLVTIETVDQVNFTGDNLEGCTPVTTNFTNTAPIAGSTCTWFISNGTTLTGCDNVAYTFTNPGCYDVTLEVTSANGCTNSFTQTDYVCVEPYPTAYFTFSPNQPTSINTEVEFTNGSIGANQYQWFFGDGASSNAVNPSNTYPEIEASYEIILEASSDFGCTDTATAVINIVEELILYVPNTFTPDQDDFNPSFQPVFTSGYDPFDFHLMIFNRWGEIIFESFDASIGWDGTYGSAANGGELIKNGTYVWKIEVKVTKNDERKVFVGHVNVLK